MKRDVGFYIEANIEQVYYAYLKAAINKPFERSCKEEPFHTISFGVNFSFKYNMNGGACTIHLMPWGSGTAVNIRFSIAQAAGARYEKYANDLNAAMQAFLPVVPCPAAFNVDDFLNPQNQVTPEKLQNNTAPVASAPIQETPVATPVAPAPASETSFIAAFCTNCGTKLSPNGRFCPGCGTQTAAPAYKVCPNCHAQANSSASFCTSCGTRL